MNVIAKNRIILISLFRNFDNVINLFNLHRFLKMGFYLRNNLYV